MNQAGSPWSFESGPNVEGARAEMGVKPSPEGFVLPEWRAMTPPRTQAVIPGASATTRANVVSPSRLSTRIIAHLFTKTSDAGTTKARFPYTDGESMATGRPGVPRRGTPSPWKTDET